MKILFDTNVLVAGFLNRGTCREVISIASIIHQVYYTDFIITELQNVLKNKFNIPEFLIKGFTTLIKKYFNMAETAPIVHRVCRDSSDDQILADALFNEMDLVVTGDTDILELKTYQGIKIISPREFFIPSLTKAYFGKNFLISL